MGMTMTFDLVCDYAKQYYKPRPAEENSRAKDMTQTYWIRPWDNAKLMVLYEGERRQLKGRDKPEVCWICVDEYGNLTSTPSRHFRLMGCSCGFGFNDTGRQAIIDYYYNKNNKNSI